MKNSPSVEVISFTHNDAFYLDYLVKWYLAKFSNLTVTIFDNFSTDNMQLRQNLWAAMLSRGETAIT